MRTILGVTLLLAGLSSAAVAAVPTNAPEIDGMTAISALTLVGGALLVLRSRRR